MPSWSCRPVGTRPSARPSRWGSGAPTWPTTAPAHRATLRDPATPPRGPMSSGPHTGLRREQRFRVATSSRERALGMIAEQRTGSGGPMKLAAGIHRIGDHSIVNAYLLEDAGEVTIIDAGVPGYYRDIPRELAAMGRPARAEE